MFVDIRSMPFEEVTGVSTKTDKCRPKSGNHCEISQASPEFVVTLNGNHGNVASQPNCFESYARGDNTHRARILYVVAGNFLLL